MDRMRHMAFEVSESDSCWRIGPKLVHEEFPREYHVGFARLIVHDHTLGNVCVGEKSTPSAPHGFSDR